MSNSIWKTPEETPKDFCDVVLANFRTGSCCVFLSPFHNVSFDYDKWCYLTDLIAQADKAERLEKENEAMREEFEVWHGNHKCVLEDNERLQKAVDNYEKVIVGAMLAPDVGDVTAGMLEESHKTIKQLIKGE